MKFTERNNFRNKLKILDREIEKIVFLKKNNQTDHKENPLAEDKIFFALKKKGKKIFSKNFLKKTSKNLKKSSKLMHSQAFVPIADQRQKSLNLLIEHEKNPFLPKIPLLTHYNSLSPTRNYKNL